MTRAERRRTAGECMRPAPAFPGHSTAPAEMPAHVSVLVHVDELVLHGLAATDRDPIADGLAQELTRLFATEGVPAPPPAGGAPWLDAGTVETARAAAPAAIGRQLARTVYHGSQS